MSNGLAYDAAILLKVTSDSLAACSRNGHSLII
jgi:hypothetical protein